VLALHGAREGVAEPNLVDPWSGHRGHEGDGCAVGERRDARMTRDVELVALVVVVLEVVPQRLLVAAAGLLADHVRVPAETRRGGLNQ